MQGESMDRIHVLVGANDDLNTFTDAVASGESISWIVPKAAQVGDDAAVFFPGKGFVGFATIASAPKRSPFRRRRTYSAYIEIGRHLEKPVPLSELKKKVRGWPWLRYPRSFTTVSGATARALVGALREATGGPPPRTDALALPALEGILREVKAVTKSRNGRLRSQALEHAAGVCAVCRTDFSRLLDGRGVHVLQVHHRNQLSASKVPRTTQLRDLAVVCANCHALIHMDPHRALRVEHLRRMLASQ